MKKRLLLIAIAIVTIVAAWNAPLTYHIGIDGKVYEKKIPLYAKACGFLYRDWMYKDIIRDIVNGMTSDEERAIAILRWTYANIERGVPPGLHAVDDHPLNIIIRQYGQDDQLEDIFTILCSYAGMHGGMEKCYNQSRTKHIILSFVLTREGSWLIFDASKEKYFLNDKGTVADVDDYINGRIRLSEDDRRDYGEFLEDVKNIDFSGFTRAKEQMPLKRVFVEINKLFVKK